MWDHSRVIYIPHDENILNYENVTIHIQGETIEQARLSEMAVAPDFTGNFSASLSKSDDDITNGY